MARRLIGEVYGVSEEKESKLWMSLSLYAPHVKMTLYASHVKMAGVNK